jgi:8-oxo-dGTP pyrophosphatase MutT (NUDIX family)
MNIAVPAPTEKHHTVTVYIVTDQSPRKALLLHHRKLGSWLPPGGHQESHENAYEAAIREVAEETGLDISEYLDIPEIIDEYRQYLPVPRLITQHSIPQIGDEPAHFHLDMEYVVVMPEQEVALAEVESHDIGWFTLEQINSMRMFPDVAAFLTRELAV